MASFTKLGLASTISLSLLASAVPAGAESRAQIGVKRLVLAHGVDGREPQGATTTFKTSDDRVYAFVEIENPTRAKSGINVVFEPPAGPALAEIPLEVGDGARFRTWAFTRRAHEPGEWTVVVRDAKHRVLARQTFTVTK
jgi:hypothetical protein